MSEACGICGSVGAALVRDHDHRCCPGRSGGCPLCYRGWLCQRCNSGLGMFLDDPRLLRRAIRYLAAPRPGALPPAPDPRQLAWTAQSREDRLVAHLRHAYPGWLSTNQINDAFSRNTGKGRAPVSAITEHLVRTGEVEKRRILTSGRPRTEYRLTGTAIANMIQCQ